MFSGSVRFAERCSVCALDYSNFNVGDGPAALLILGIGAIILVLAIMLDMAVRPPFWVHAAIWIPVATTLTVYSLRVAKGALLVSEYRNNAREAGGGDVT